jgi:outer membrane protein OmpA-like peptidoglycan-associated protein
MALLITTATAAGAQTAGTFEITGFGRYTRFDNTLGLQEGASGGGSLGFYPIRNLAVEAEAAYTETHSNLTGVELTNIPLRGRLTYHFPLGGYGSALRIGSGYVRNLYRKNASIDDNGFTGLVGFRWGLSPSFGFRVDGTADLVTNPEGNWTGEYLNWGAQVGLTLKVGGGSRKPKDRDQDAVFDQRDICPNTEFGKSVDANGCAAYQKDADRDRVNDELDRCADTGAGEPVDSEGCSATQKDDDKDGVLNSVDQCPNTPWGENPNGSGCAGSQRDEDRDGVSDALDQCPNTPSGEVTNYRGCSRERDSDGDNVPDAKDRCPNTARGEVVDQNGCTIVVPERVVTERDSDGDGVPDQRDRCPDTPKTEAADAKGCTILFHKGARTVILRGVTFRTGRATLTPAAREILRNVASQLVENPQYRVQISGHTDNTGSRAANLRLSLARARTVETFLVANGVPHIQVTAKGFGPDVPIGPNKTAAGRAKNRRVELNRTN